MGNWGGYRPGSGCKKGVPHKSQKRRVMWHGRIHPNAALYLNEYGRGYLLDKLIQTDKGETVVPAKMQADLKDGLKRQKVGVPVCKNTLAIIRDAGNASAYVETVLLRHIGGVCVMEA